MKRSTELAPEASNPAYALAQTLNEAGLPSVDAYVRALRLAPGTPEMLLGLTAALIAERRIDEAVGGLERAVSVKPQWVPGHATLSRLRWMQGERQGFTRSYDEALARMPANLDLRRDQIIALVHAEHWDDALRAISAGRAAVGPHTIFDANEAAVYAELGEQERADALFAQLADVPGLTDPGPTGAPLSALRAARLKQAAPSIPGSKARRRSSFGRTHRLRGG